MAPPVQCISCLGKDFTKGSIPGMYKCDGCGFYYQTATDDDTQTKQEEANKNDAPVFTVKPLSKEQAVDYLAEREIRLRHRMEAIIRHKARELAITLRIPEPRSIRIDWDALEEQRDITASLPLPVHNPGFEFQVNPYSVKPIGTPCLQQVIDDVQAIRQTVINNSHPNVVQKGEVILESSKELIQRIEEQLGVPKSILAGIPRPEWNPTGETQVLEDGTKVLKGAFNVVTLPKTEWMGQWPDKDDDMPKPDVVVE